MKKILLSLLVLLLVGSCVANQTPAPVDPLLEAGRAQATADAKLREVEYYGIQLTGTAEAPLKAFTLTAADITLQSAYALGTETAAVKTQSANLTATATLWTPTPTFTPTPNATQTLSFAQLDAQVQEIQNDTALDNLKVDRARKSNDFWTIALPIFLLCALLAVAYIAITYSRTIRKREVKRDAHGNAPLIVDIVDGFITDMDASPNYSTNPKLPPVTASRQDGQRAIQAQILKKLPSTSSAKIEAAPQPVIPAEKRIEVLPEQKTEEKLLPLPSWEMLRNWNFANGLPYGVNARTGELEAWDYSKLPHLSVFGMTGSGKSRRFLRPLVASMLAANQRVLLLGKETDFQPFVSHPNALVIPVYELTERDEAAKYSYALEQCVKEQNIRARHLVEVGASTWQRAGYENTFIVLDEIGNALRQMPKDVARMSFNHVVSLVNEGRKVGFNVVFSSQRPKSFIDLTTQCGQAVFLVRNDRESGYALGQPGAERLREGYFFARFGDLKLAGAFEPDDAQIIDLLKSVTVKTLEKPKWIEAKQSANAPLIIPQETQESLEAGRIKSLHAEGKTEGEIIREIWGVYGGGSFYNRREQVRKVLTSSSPEITVNRQ
ncbi:MAG: hypothetical protein IPL32_18015 [Chloracidobacterium sp.]|nr:hypothetical protein [Chloracidobacterium sp.]